MSLLLQFGQQVIQQPQLPAVLPDVIPFFERFGLRTVEQVRVVAHLPSTHVAAPTAAR